MPVRKIFLILILLISGFLISYANTKFLIPKTTEIYNPINLGLGNTTSVEFKVNKTRLYTIGIEMDEEDAGKIYPCDVIPTQLSDDCRTSIPIKFRLFLLENNRVITSEVSPPYPQRGGSYYSGKYLREIGRLNLEKNKKYKLLTTSLEDGTPLITANPKLVITEDSKYLEPDTTIRLITFIVGIFATIICLIIFLFTRRKTQTQKND